MNFLKGVLYFILILVGAILLAALFAPATKVIERTISIKAPKAAVFNQIATFENWKNWDPWYKLDSAQVRTYNGKLGDKDYGYSWKSENENVGQGSIKALSFKDYDQFDYLFTFGEGVSDASEGYFKLNELDGVTTIKWVMVSKQSFPFKIMNYFMERFIAPDFEKGLANLKAHVEANPEVPAEPRRIEIVSEHGVNYATIRAEGLSIVQLDSFLSASYKEIAIYLQDNGLVAKGAQCALFYSWDTLTKVTTVASAVPISDILEEQSEDLNLPIGKVKIGSNTISYLHVGKPSKTRSIHTALGDWIVENGKEAEPPAVEYFVNGRNIAADSMQTRIIYTFK